MDMGLFIAEKFKVDINKELSIDEKNTIGEYFEKNGLSCLGDDGCIVLQLLYNWVKAEKFRKIRNFLNSEGLLK